MATFHTTIPTQVAVAWQMPHLFCCYFWQKVLIYCDILTVTYLQLSGLPCPIQRYSDVVSYAEVMIEKTGDVVYTITAGIMGKQLYTASVSVVGSDGVVDALKLNFSELVDFDRVTL